MALVFTKENFESEVLKSKVPVLVDFWAPWCGPCKMIAPIVDELAGEYEGRLKIGKLNTDENLEIANQLQITSIPTILFYKDGKIANKIIGFKSKNDLINIISGIL